MKKMMIKGIIEIPKDSFYKYEVDKADGVLTLDRILGLPIPHNYGYIPETLSEDGDPLDVYICSHYPIPPMTRVTLKVWAVIFCKDSGDNDEKLICTIKGDPFLIYEPEITDYLSKYKPGKIEIIGVGNKDDAIRILQEAQNRYRNNLLEEGPERHSTER